MSDKSARGKTLVLVEGIGEKEQFFRTLCRAFPELNIHKEDIFVYQTNIYRLLQSLKAEYGDDLPDMDVDLPTVLRKDHPELTGWRKDSFVNILLIFDFEIQDPGFSPENIRLLQSVFNDVTDNGQLYLNYPMYESCYDCKSLNDPDFTDSSVKLPAAGNSVKWSGEYKQRVKEKRNDIRNMLFLTIDRIEQILKEAGITGTSCLEELYSLKKRSMDDNHTKVTEILNRYTKVFPAESSHRLSSVLFRECSLQSDENYNEFLRKGLKTLAGMHFRKACRLQKDSSFDPRQLLEAELAKMKEEQKLYIVNTGILFLADFNSNLIA